MTQIDDWLNWFIYSAYAIQIVLLVSFPVPSSLSSLRMLRLRSQRKKPDQTENRADSRLSFTAAALRTFVFLSLIVFWAIPLLVSLLPWLYVNLLPIPVPHPHLFIVLSAGLLTTSSVLVIWAVLSLRKNVIFFPTGEPKTLYTGGIFRIIRHPLNFGLFGIALGVTLAVLSWPMLFGFSFFTLNLYRHTRKEEDVLVALFGQGYQDYARRTGRFFPRLNHLCLRIIR